MNAPVPQDIYTGLLSCEVEPYSTDHIEFLNLVDQHSDDANEEVRAFMLRQPTLPILLDRQHYAPGVLFDESVTWFFALIASNPGQLVMWTFTQALMGWLVHHPITVAEFHSIYFPRGLPTEDAMRLAWDAQKVSGRDSDNLLDDRSFWKERFEIQ